MNVFADAGKPMLLIPTQVEQMMFSTRVAEAGLAKVFPLGGEVEAVKPLFDDFFRDEALVSRATKWATDREIDPMAARVSTACDLIESQLSAC